MKQKLNIVNILFMGGLLTASGISTPLPTVVAKATAIPSITPTPIPLSMITFTATLT